MTDLKITRKTRVEGGSFDILEPEEGAEAVHFDGYAGLAFGSGMVKIGFYSVIGVEGEEKDQIERRLIKLHLSMPAANFAEMCAHSLVNMKVNQSGINSMYDEAKAKIDALVKNIEIPTSKSEGNK